MRAALLMVAVILSACTSSPKVVSGMEACQEALDARCTAVQDCGGDKAMCEAQSNCSITSSTFPTDQLDRCIADFQMHGCMGTMATYSSDTSAAIQRDCSVPPAVAVTTPRYASP